MSKTLKDLVLIICIYQGKRGKFYTNYTGIEFCLKQNFPKSTYKMEELLENSFVYMIQI